MEGPHTQHEGFSTSRGTRSQTLHKVHGHPALQISLPPAHAHSHGSTRCLAKITGCVCADP